MIYKNEHNLPQHVLEILQYDEYDFEPSPNSISVTGLVQPLRATILKRKGGESTVDISRYLNSLYGTALHSHIEKALENNPNVDLMEKRFTAEINGWRLSGKLDFIYKGIIHDNKKVTCFNIKKDEVHDYVSQMSMYRWLLHKNDWLPDSGLFPPEMAVIDKWIFDWTANKHRQDPRRIPPVPYQARRIHLWNLQQTENWIVDRLSLITTFEEAGKLPECTWTELWADEEVWAVMKKGRKSAIKGGKQYSKENAEKVLAIKDKTHYIEYRMPQVKRCKYCAVASVCEQCKRLDEQGLIQW